MVVACAALMTTAYSAGVVEPQKEGWPLSLEEKAYVMTPVDRRRPTNPEQWPVTPVAGSFGPQYNADMWLSWHSKLVDEVTQNEGPVDILLVGDSITQRWGSPIKQKPLNEIWQKYFGQYKTINLGLGGDRTSFVLWRLNHSALENIQPRLVILLIGVNNMHQIKDTGAVAIAKGMQACVENLRGKCPDAHILALTVFPADYTPKVLTDIQCVNDEFLKLRVDRDPLVTVLDLHNEFLRPDGTVNAALYCDDRLHLASEAGYEFYAQKLKPVVDKLLAP